jgi:3-oxoacid CoA-transferase
MFSVLLCINHISKMKPSAPSLRIVATPFAISATITCRGALRQTRTTRWRGFATTAFVRREAPPKGSSKLYEDADAAVADIQSGSTILSSGFGLCGVAGSSSFTSGDDVIERLCSRVY